MLESIVEDVLSYQPTMNSVSSHVYSTMENRESYHAQDRFPPKTPSISTKKRCTRTAKNEAFPQRLPNCRLYLLLTVVWVLAVEATTERTNAGLLAAVAVIVVALCGVVGTRRVYPRGRGGGAQGARKEGSTT